MKTVWKAADGKTQNIPVHREGRNGDTKTFIAKSRQQFDGFIFALHPTGWMVQRVSQQEEQHVVVPVQEHIHVHRK